MTYLAESDLSAGTFTPTQLIAGDFPISTQVGKLLSGQNLAKYAVVAMNTAGKLVVYDQAGVGPLGEAVGILAEAMDASAGDKDCQYYVSGHFNHEALVWPAATDTLLERQYAFRGRPIQIKAVV